MATANQDRSRVEVLRRRDYPTSGTGTINIGDMLIDDGSGNAIRATGTADQVADAFIGIAIHAKPTDRVPLLAVAADVVAEMDLPSGIAVAAKMGDSVEFSSALSNAQTVAVGSTNPIGKVYRPAPVGSTTIMVHLVGRDIRGPVAPD